MLHLPIGILVLAVIFEILVRFPKFKFIEPAVGPTWVAGAVTAVLTAILGLMHATESGFQDSDAVDAHRFAGLTLAAVACLIAVMRTRLSPLATTGKPTLARNVYTKLQPLWAPGALVERAYAKAWPVGVAVIGAMMFVTGHLGGNLTHGDTFLVQYAPTPIRRMAGISPERDPRAKPKDLASADLYLDVVAPAIHQRCDGCHNDSKTSGGLSMADHAKILKGGEKGPVIVPGDPAKSALFRRISLSPSDKDYMPKDGKTPLTQEQIAAIGAWISAGAPKTGAVGTLKIAATAKPALEKALGLTGGAGGEDDLPPGTVALPSVPLPDSVIVVAMENSGFVVRPIAPKSGLVDVDFTARRTINQEDLDRLGKLSRQVRKLNLRRAGLTDAQMKTLAGFENLAVLRLDDDAITDAGLAPLMGLKNLTSVNLVGTKVTDAGVASLTALPKLQRVYVWGTGATKAGALKLAAAHPKLVVDLGLSRADVPPPGPQVQALN
ncbi:MAG: c-type cytochrome domain-containing protein [Caulobacteraceae bacterium]